jgi:hypothetical protein
LQGKVQSAAVRNRSFCGNLRGSKENRRVKVVRSGAMGGFILRYGPSNVGQCWVFCDGKYLDGK